METREYSYIQEADDDNQRRHQRQSPAFERKIEPLGKRKSSQMASPAAISNIKFAISCGLFNLFPNFPARCRARER